MTANEHTPSSGESVSDEEAFQQLVSEEVIECRYLLNKCVRRGVETDEIRSYVEEVRSRVERLEREIEEASEE